MKSYSACSSIFTHRFVCRLANAKRYRVNYNGHRSGQRSEWNNGQAVLLGNEQPCTFTPNELLEFCAKSILTSFDDLHIQY